MDGWDVAFFGAGVAGVLACLMIWQLNRGRLRRRIEDATWR